jgi:hypothetical protein
MLGKLFQEIRMSRFIAVFVILSLTGCSKDAEPNQAADSSSDSSDPSSSRVAELVIPIGANRGPNVEDGFQGSVHPALDVEQSLIVRATCSRIPKGRGFAEGYFPQQFRGPFDQFVVANKTHKYFSGDFSPFLPQEFGEPGQIWEIDATRILRFLKQFHAGASMSLQSPGRRSGPNGAFAVLRAISDKQIEVLARIHAEFVVDEDSFITPAYFECRLLIDRTTSRVNAFMLSIPTAIHLNATLTAALATEALIDIVHLDQMELVGGDVSTLKTQTMANGISLETARANLKRVFYKFLDVDWVKPEMAVAEARKQQRPIMAIVLWGDLDDQSC